MKTAEDFVKEMESSNILMSRERTFREYVSEIKQFQQMVCQMIAGDAYYDKMRIEEAMFIMESRAREKGLRNNPAVHNGVLTMKDLVKEIAITMSGAKGEDLVSRTLEFLERPNTKIFRNVYITDGIEETELDGIVLTDNGIIILEVKKVKSDVTLTEDGRMVFAGDECYDKVPLAEKMALKRRLFSGCLEKATQGKGLDIPIFVDSYIVFSTPKGQRVRLNDRYHREKYCFRTGLNKKIENYSGSGFYRADQLEQLDGILSEMESNVKRFETKLDYSEVRRSLAEAMAVLQDDSGEMPEEAHLSTSEHHPVQIIGLDTTRISQEQKRLERKAVKFGYAVASVFVGVFISGAVAVLSMGNRHI